MTKTFDHSNTIWCAGCGHFGVRNALVSALTRLEIPAHETMVLAGIGCSGTVQNNVPAYGYHALHGRVLPAALGVTLANPELTVIAAGGDGDGYAIGAGHLVHTFKRNPGFVYVLMNNAVYGLTKGQNSPTAQLDGTDVESAMDGIALGLSLPGTTFLARAFSGNPEQLDKLMTQALEHSRGGNGFAFLEVLSPCVTYNDTYASWSSQVVDVNKDASYDNTDRAGAFKMVYDMTAEGRIPTGLIFQGQGCTMESRFEVGGFGTPASQSAEIDAHLDDYRDLMTQYAV
jgi:2-oxoglutarate/2-oxoacid ferredoxin oxidoreductase subunit beta